MNLIGKIRESLIMKLITNKNATLHFINLYTNKCVGVKPKHKLAGNINISYH